jgi:outer membrane protein assembly factor BamB
MKNYIYPCLLAALLVTSGCDKKKGEPITGERETVFVGDDPLRADPSLKGVKVQIPAAQRNKAWATASGNSEHTMPPLVTGTLLTKAWSTSMGVGSGESARLLNGPVSVDGKVFAVDTDGRITAVSLETGEHLWDTETATDNKPSQAFSGGVAYENGKVFAVTPTAEIVMIDANSGKIEQRFPLVAPVRAAPTVKDGHIYAVTINNQLEVIDYKTGKPAWSHSGVMETAGLLGGASPAVTNDIVIVPYTSGEVYALHPATGMPLWTESLISLSKLDPVSALVHVKARPVVKDNRVYLIGNSGVMRCLVVNTGKTIWSHKVGGIRTPAVAGNYLFVVTNNSELTCIDRATGKIHWVKQLPQFEGSEDKTDPILWAGPTLAKDSLIVAGSSGKALVLSVADGHILQELDLGTKTLLSPIIVDGHVLFMTDSAELIAFK